MKSILRATPFAIVAIAFLVAPAEAADGASLLDRFTVWVFEQQRAFHRELTGGLRALNTGGGVVAGWGLVVASFLYGFFHAAGPGHGKVILSTYLLTHRSQMRKGVAIAAVAAFCQGAVALILVYGLIALSGIFASDTARAITWSERASYALVFVLGAFLAVRAVRKLANSFGWIKSAAPVAVASAGGDHHHHGHHHSHGHHHHDGHHDHDHECCGHSHGPTAEQLDQASDLRTTLGVILSIGLRPCSGAVIVLVAANVMGLWWAGIGSVMAMSFGTALATATLAFIAVNARGWVTAIGLGESRSGQAIGTLISLGGGVVIMVVGLSLLSGSFAPAHPLGLS